MGGRFPLGKRRGARASRPRFLPPPAHVPLHLGSPVASYLPVAAEPEHDSETVRRRALVVDDDAAIRILVTRILTRHGFLVDPAADGAEAIEQLLQHDYALITLDLMMPRIDGYGVMKYLADHKPELFGRVIVMTAFGASALEKVCPPVVRFIHKPFDIERLLAEAESAAVPDAAP